MGSAMGAIEEGEFGGVSYRVSEQAGSTLVALTGELDLASIDELETALGPVVAALTTPLIVDAAGLRFADSSAIALWIRWSQAVPDFELRNPPAIVRRVIETMGLSGRFGLS